MVAEPASVAAAEGTGYPPFMFRFAAALALLAGLGTAAGPSVAEPLLLPCSREGSWTAADRQLHFGLSLAIAASLRVEGRSRIESVAGTAAIGVAKEIYDATLKPRRLLRGASRKDLAADLLGAVAGVLLIAAVDR